MFKSKKEKLDKEIMKDNLSAYGGDLEDIDSENQLSSSGNVSGESAKGGEDIDKKNKTNEIDKEEPSKEDNLQTQLDVLKDQFFRKAAEFENYKKRTENELSSFFKYANETLILEMLPVLDDFDRVLNAWNEKHDTETFKKGVELIYDKFRGILKKQGLREMESDGKKFDFNLHDALLQIPDEKNKPETILETAEKGYYLKDKVIRHAKVLVSSSPENKSKPNESSLWGEKSVKEPDSLRDHGSDIAKEKQKEK